VPLHEHPITMGLQAATQTFRNHHHNPFINQSK